MEGFSLWAMAKLLLKPLTDFFINRMKTAKAKKVDLNRFYVELTDVRDKAIDAIRLLAGEHNRCNDPIERRGRRWNSYGPISSPFRIDFFTIKGIFERQYEDFTTDQRRTIGEVFEFADEYNTDVAELKLLNGKMYSDFRRSFAVGPIATLATLVFLTTKLIEHRERFKVSDTETATTAVQKVLDGWNIRLFDIQFSDPD